jgi:hypothetical protein
VPTEWIAKGIALEIEYIAGAPGPRTGDPVEERLTMTQVRELPNKELIFLLLSHTDASCKSEGRALIAVPPFLYAITYG